MGAAFDWNSRDKEGMKHVTTSRLLAGASGYSFKEGKLRGVERRSSELFPFCVPAGACGGLRTIAAIPNTAGTYHA